MRRPPIQTRRSEPGCGAAGRPGARHARLAAGATTRGWRRSSGSCSTGSPGPAIEPMRTPILEFTELHERKSGAGIVSKLFELAGRRIGRDLSASRADGEHRAGLCRGAGVPRPALAREQLGPGVPLRERPAAGRLREFTQVGVELIGAAGPPPTPR